MSLYKQLKTRASDLRKQAKALEQAAAGAEKAQATARAKIAQAREQGTAETHENKVRIGQLAKHAAAGCLSAGLLSDARQADVLAAQLMTHEQAIQKVAQLAKLCERLPRSAQVVTDNRAAEKTAHDIWDEEARAVLATLPPG